MQEGVILPGQKDENPGVTATGKIASNAINIIFAAEGPSLRFIEVEDDDGNSISVGDWIEQANGIAVLRIERYVLPYPVDTGEKQIRGTGSEPGD